MNIKALALFIVAFFILFVCYAKYVSAGVIFEENWDGVAPTNGFPNTRGSIWNGWEVGDYGGEQGYSELSAGVYYSAPRALYQLKKANENFVKDLIKNFSATNEIRIRFYVYFDSDYANYGSVNPDIGSDYVHFMFLQSALSGRGVRMDIISYTSITSTNPIEDLRYPWPPTCCAGINYDWDAGFFSIASPSGFGGPSKGVTRDRPDLCFNIKDNLERWMLVEWAYKIVNTNEGRLSLWIDGVEMMKDELLPPDPDYMTIDRMLVSGYMSNLRNYDVGYYIDDLIVTDNYDTEIGPLGYSAPTPADIISPSIPINILATAVSSSQINLSWTASTDPSTDSTGSLQAGSGQVTSGISGYKIYRDGSYLTSVSNTSYADTNLSSLAIYSYTVSAYDAAGNESNQSTSASATTYRKGDINKDGQVNSADFILLIAKWWQTSDISDEDLNSDGLVNARDLGRLMREWLD